MSRGKFATVREKYGKCRTFDGTPQIILFQDVEQGSLERKLQNLALYHFVLLAAWESQLLYISFFMAHSSVEESNRSPMPNQ